MAGIVPTGWTVPGASEMHIARPVKGASLVGLAGAFNHLNALHARGFSPVGCYQLARLASASAEDIGYIEGEVLNETHHVPYYVPPGVALLHVAMLVLSYETGGTADPSVTMDIRDDAGGTIDEGCTWARAEGTMPGHERLMRGRYRLYPALIESAVAFLSTDPTSGPTGPRRLSVSGKDGDVVVLRVVTVRAMLVGLFVLPVPPVSL